MSTTALAVRTRGANVAVGQALVRAPERLAQVSLCLRGFQSRRLQTSVGRVHVVDGRGPGPMAPTVLLHGFSAAAFHYHDLIRDLRPHVSRVVAPDMPGHGLSETPRAGMGAEALQRGLFETLDQCLAGSEPAVIFGNSMGGLAAIRYAAKNPEKVRALVLVSPGGAAMSQAEIEDFLRVFRVNTHAEALVFADRLFAMSPMVRHVIAWGVQQKFGHENMRALLSSLRPQDLLTPEELGRLTMPTLFLWGGADRVMPVEHLQFFRKHLPKHVVIEEPAHYSHSPFLDSGPDLFARTLGYLRDVHAGRAKGAAPVSAASGRAKSAVSTAELSAA